MTIFLFERLMSALKAVRAMLIGLTSAPPSRSRVVVKPATARERESLKRRDS